MAQDDKKVLSPDYNTGCRAIENWQLTINEKILRGAQDDKKNFMAQDDKKKAVMLSFEASPINNWQLTINN